MLRHRDLIFAPVTFRSSMSSAIPVTLLPWLILSAARGSVLNRAKEFGAVGGFAKNILFWGKRKSYQVGDYTFR